MVHYPYPGIAPSMPPCPEVPPSGFVYRGKTGARHYHDPRDYSIRMPWRPRGWNVRPPLDFAPGPYLRRIFGGCRESNARIAYLYIRAHRRALRVLGGRCRIYSERYGETGALISGGFRESWPDSAKDAVRAAARRATEYANAARAHWRAAGKLDRTFRRAMQLAEN